MTKLSPTGTILFSTYGGVDSGSGITVNSTGFYFTGDTSAPDVDNPIGYGGGRDLFIWKLSPTGDGIYSNLYAGPGHDFGNAVALDSQGNAWVAGVTYPTDEFGPSGNVLVVKFGPTGQMLYSQTYGSNGEDIANGIAVDPADQPWITGKACGIGFPVTNGPLDTISGCHVFVLQLERTGNMRMSMVFGGSNGGDAGTAIVPNGSDAAYVTGYTHAANFPTTADGFQTVRASIGAQAFVTEVNSASFVGHSETPVKAIRHKCAIQSTRPRLGCSWHYFLSRGAIRLNTSCATILLPSPFG